MEGESGRIFTGDGDRRAVAPAWGRRAPLLFKLALPVASLKVGVLDKFTRAVLLIFARTTTWGGGEIVGELDGLGPLPLMR